MAKKYIDADLLKKEVEKRRHICYGVYERDSDTYYQGKAVAYQETLSIINSLQQEQPCDTCTNDKGCVTCKDGELWEGKEQPSEDLKEAAEEYSKRVSDGHNYRDLICGFIAGAEWQKSKMPMLEEVKVKGWVARDKDGTITLFRDKPIRYGDSWTSKNRQPEDATFGPLSPNAFLGLKWEDEPVEVGLIVKILQHITMAEDKKTTLEKAKWMRERMMTDEEMKCALRMEYEKGVFDTKQQMPMPEDTVIFQKGIEEGKRLMLEEAVEGVVMDFSSNLPRPQVDIRLDPHKYHTGDKVKVIIVKED